MTFFNKLPIVKIVALFLAAAVLALTIPSLPAKLFIFLALVFALIDARRQWSDRVVRSNIRKFLPILILFLLALFFAIFNSTSINQLNIKDIIFSYLSIVGNVVILILVVQYATDKKFLKIIYFSFLIPLLLAPILFFWNRLNVFTPFKDIYNFNSLVGGPTYYFATLLIIPAIALFWVLLVKKHYLLKFFSFIGLVFIFALILWSGSRATWLALIVTFLFLSFKILKFDGGIWFKLRQATLTLLLISAVGIGGFSVLPCGVKLFVLSRLNNNALNAYTDYIWGIPDNTLCRNLVSEGIHNLVTFQGTNIFISQDRFNLWQQAAAYSIENPFGYGSTYANLVDITEGDKSYVSAHNLFLEGFLSGGFILLAIIIFFVYWSMSYIFGMDRAFYRSSILSTVNPALFAVFIRFFFADVLFSRWLWILIALFVALRLYHENMSRVPEIKQ